MEKAIMNKKQSISYFIGLLLTLNINILNAYYYQASGWEKDDQTIVLLRDRHNPPSYQKKRYLHAIQNQRKDLLNFLESTQSFTIIEDLDTYSLELSNKLDRFLEAPSNYDPNKNLEFSLEELLPKLKNIPTPLVGFTQCCHASDIPAIDIDFRFFNLDSLKDDLTIKDAYKMCKKALSEIESYNDYSILKNFYPKNLSNIKKQFSSYETFYNHFMTKGMPHRDINRLIDLKIIHHIYNNNNYTFIVVLAGGAHISRTEKILPQLGYRKKSSSYKMGMKEDVLNLKQYLSPFLAKN